MPCTACHHDITHECATTYTGTLHGQDAWAIMPEAVVLSAVVFLLACVATWLGFSGYRRGAP